MKKNLCSVGTYIEIFFTFLGSHLPNTLYYSCYNKYESGFLNFYSSFQFTVKMSKLWMPRFRKVLKCELINFLLSIVYLKKRGPREVKNHAGRYLLTKRKEIMELISFDFHLTESSKIFTIFCEITYSMARFFK